jgi:hypothetical protein
VFRKYRRLLPSPDAGPDASKYEERVDSQGSVSRIFGSYRTFALKRKMKQLFLAVQASV